jgi:hypothetical protein
MIATLTPSQHAYKKPWLTSSGEIRLFLGPLKMEYLVTSSLFEEKQFPYKGQKTVFSGRLLQH